jgi:zinc protease
MRAALLISIVALATLAPMTVRAAQELPPAPPIGEPRPFRLPATDHYRLPNGLSVTLIPYGVAPKTVVSLRVQAGGLNEGENPWLADVLAEMMKEGAADRSATDVATAAAGMGGELVVGSGDLTTQVSLNVLSEHAPAAIALAGDVARRPVLPGSELARIKANLGRQLAQAMAQPGVLADVALARAVYGDQHPFGRPLVSPQQLEGYTLEQVKDFHATEFGARRAHLYVAGRFDAGKVKAAIQDAFEAWEPGPEPLALPANPAPGPQVIFVDRPGAPQTTLRLAFKAPVAGTTGDMAHRAMNQLLGGAFSSRITTNIREDKGYSYSPFSDTEFSPGGALWTFQADVTTEVTGASLKEVFAEIRRLQAEAPSDEESKGIRTYMAGVFAIGNSTSGAIVNTVATRDLLGLPDDWLENYVPAVLAVTQGQMRDTAAANLPLDKLTLIAVGDLKKITSQLKALPELRNIPFRTVKVP